ncbi:MAG: hypothetical protein HZB85_03155 [Deltaproteobacteria bacterium]|nr:hypothetical protein [Deltaproteobacteria bacterium]
MTTAKLTCVFLITLFIQTLFYQSSFAGQLGNFEKAATEKKADNKDDDTIFDLLFDDVIGDLFIRTLVEGGKLSMERVSQPKTHNAASLGLRHIGDSDLPYFRSDINYQLVNSNVWGLDGRIEVGYGAVGLQFRQTHYEEKKPHDSLDIVNIHGLYRISFSKKFELDMGIGRISMSGKDENSGASVTSPMNFYPHENICIRFAPTWNWINGNQVSDYDGSIAYINEFYSIRAGYRRMKAGEEVLDGPYFGMSYHY